MVKLVFNPKNQTNLTNLTNLTNVLKSKTSKKNENVNVSVSLNPFSNLNSLNSLNLIKTDSRQTVETLKCRDLVGLENCNFILKKWYFSLDNLFLLIIGPIGCGKTTLINSFCNEENINLLNLQCNKPKRDILKDIDLFLDYSLQFFKNDGIQQKKIILIDEYQNGQNDSLTIMDILALKEKGIKIIIVSSDSKGSKLSDLKKSVEVYYINEIPSGLIKTWILSLMDNNFNLTSCQLNYILKNCRSDKRSILNILDFLKKYPYKGSLDSFLQSCYKDEEINLFEFVKHLFDDIEPVGINDIFKIYDNDGFLLSNLVHENYIDFNEDIHSIAKASDAISSGEILFSDTFDSTKSFLPDLHCLNSIVIPGFYSKSSKNIKTLPRSSVINNRYNILLNNKKVISKINDLKNNFDVFDIYTIKSVLNQELIKGKCGSIDLKIEFIKNVLKSLKNNNEQDKSIERLELIYKHFSDFKKDTNTIKTKTFTLKFKQKLKTI